MGSSTSDEQALALVQQGWEHLKLQRPLAAWASWQRALRVAPGDQAASEALAHLAAAEDLPHAARAAYRFRPPSQPKRSASWDSLLTSTKLADLDGAAEAFRQIVEAEPGDAAAWYNYALCLAWKGANPQAIAALERVVQTEAAQSTGLACEAWTLAELLRLGAGAESLADDLSYSATVVWSNDDPDPETLGVLVAANQAAAVHDGAPQLKDVVAFEWLDRSMPASSDDPELADLPRMLATVIQTPRSLRLAGPDPVALADVQDKLASALNDPTRPFRREARPLAISLADAAVWVIRFPPLFSAGTRQRLGRAAVEQFFENLWIHIPRRGLDGLSPLEAARAAANGERVLSTKLEGVVAFRAQLGNRPAVSELYGGYPFDRLRRRLGLEVKFEGTVDPADLSCASAPELAAIIPSNFDDHRLADAFNSAIGLRDESLALGFARALLDRGADALKRSGAGLEPLFALLVRDASARGEAQEAQALLDDADSLDLQLTGGRNRRVFRIWRAEVFVRMGRTEAARAVYQELLAEHPQDAALALDAAATFQDSDHLADARSLAELAHERAQSNGDTVTLRRATLMLSDLLAMQPEGPKS
jgi:tetratricopeptide (TPR) repeat protein